MSNIRDPKIEEKIAKKLAEWEKAKREEIANEERKKEEAEREKRMKEEKTWLGHMESAAAKIKDAVPTAIANEESLKMREGYEIKRVDVANGRNAKIYRAVDKHGTEMYAKLVMVPGAKKKIADSFREASKCLKYLKSHSHQNVMKIYDIFTTKEKIYVFIEKLNLVKIKGGGTADEATAQKWSKDVASGLHFLHVHGIAHNHLLPENILIDSYDNLKIAGFLSATLSYDSTNKTIRKLDPLDEYFPHDSPERIKGPFDPFKADVFAFGVMIIFFMTREFPFAFAGRDKSNLPLSVQWKLCLRRKKVDISTELKDLLVDLFEVDVDKRPHIRHAAAKEWFTKEIAPTAPPPPESTTPPESQGAAPAPAEPTEPKPESPPTA
ncbi:serine/threonine-protein kinase-like protein 1 [Leptotrombidium deliense]|uniref:Serine/threonine-protein kinase-like protein 1 n=1 Tax=Leptotrombidium deliense TaxID=299467 RepID=A0A443SM88_9ACAR|nr:serine/threonine-protein kinase-like protein 1 [Leptotrombidium deliense]